MMSEVILGELQTVAIAFLSGALITFVYDLFRIFRRVVSHGNLWISIEDFVFWVWTSLWIFSILYRENDGSLRIYTIFSMILGMIVYHKVLSERFVSFVGGLLKKAVGILLYPMKKIKFFIIFLGKKLKILWKRIIMRNNR